MESKITTGDIQTLFEKYIDECRYVLFRRPETIRGAQEAFRHFRSMVPEVLTANEVTLEIVILFFKRIQTRERSIGKNRKQVGIKDSTVVTYGARLKTFFKWLFDRGHIPQNPFNLFELPRPAYTDQRSLKGEEIKKIMGAVAQHSHGPFLLKRDMAIIGILTFCGLRRNELIALETRDVDLHQGFITIRAETSKSKATRKLPINIHLRMYLSEYLEARKKRNPKSAYLLVSQTSDTPLTKHGLKHWVARLSNLSGVKFHLHRFRHTFATNLAMQDVGIVKIQTLMGHRDIKMTSKYLRSVSSENMRGDINRLSFENIK